MAKKGKIPSGLSRYLFKAKSGNRGMIGSLLGRDHVGGTRKTGPMMDRMEGQVLNSGSSSSSRVRSQQSPSKKTMETKSAKRARRSS